MFKELSLQKGNTINHFYKGSRVIHFKPAFCIYTAPSLSETDGICATYYIQGHQGGYN